MQAVCADDASSATRGSHGAVPAAAVSVASVSMAILARPKSASLALPSASSSTLDGLQGGSAGPRAVRGGGQTGQTWKAQCRPAEEQTASGETGAGEALRQAGRRAGIG